MRIGVLGTGAVGGLYGGWLANAGHDVCFLARSDAETLRSKGLAIRSPRGNLHLSRFQVAEKPSEMPQCDLVLVSWKSTANKDLAKTLAVFCSEDTWVVNLQNGLQPEWAALPSIQENKLFSGLCFLCAQREAPGQIWHQGYGSITLAAFSRIGAAGITPGLEVCASTLKSCGEDILTVSDWRLARWRKLVWNIAFNGPCALLGMNTSEILANPTHLAWIRSLMQETLAGAKACGVHIPEDFPEKMIAATRKMTPYSPSMKLDAEAGRPLETDAIYTDVIKAIQAANGHAPEIAVLEKRLRERFQ